MSNYDLYKNKSYNLRLPAEKKSKLEAIAKRKNIKLSKLLENILTDYIINYEKLNGTINLDTEE